MRVPEARGGEQKLTSPTRMVRSEYIFAQDRMDSRRRRTSAEAERLTVLFAAGTDKNHVCHLRARMLGRSCRTTTRQNLYIYRSSFDWAMRIYEGTPAGAFGVGGEYSDKTKAERGSKCGRDRD